MSEPEPQGIRLDGQVLYPSAPDAAPPAVRGAWAIYEQAWSVEPPQPPDPSDGEAYRAFARASFGTYLDGQVSAAMQLLEHLSNATAPNERLVHSVLAARVLHRAASWMWTVPLPDEGTVDAAARLALEQTLRQGAQPVAGYASAAYQRCMQAADELGGRGGSWRADCEARADSLAVIRDATFQPPGPPPIPDSCVDHADPMIPAPAHDPEARPALLVQVAHVEDGIDGAVLERAVSRWARRTYDLRLIPAGRVRAARALVESGRLERRGPVCATPPSIEWVLGLRERNLVVAEVAHRCETIETEEGEDTVCRLEVVFSRAGSTEGVPYGRMADVPADADARALATIIGSWDAGDISLEGEFEGRRRLSVAPVEGNPGYRIRRALVDLSLHECEAFHGLAELNLRWTVTPAGVVEDVGVEWNGEVLAESGTLEALFGCVKRKLETLKLPCTPNGEPQEMSTSVCLSL